MGTGSTAVVGAGPAGLSAAWRLRKAGWPVTVYEAAPGPGGRVRTDELEGVRLDPGPQFVGGHYTRTLALLEELGRSGEVLPARGRDALLRGGRIHGITYGSPTSMATSGALPVSLKLRLLSRYLPFLVKERSGLDAADPSRGNGPALDVESIAAWGRREMGSEFVELLVYPLLASYSNMTPEDTSAGYYHALASVGLDVRVMGLRGGIGTLPAVLGGCAREGGRRAAVRPSRRGGARGGGTRADPP